MDSVLDILMSASFWAAPIRIATPYIFGALMRYPLALNYSVMAGLVPAIHVFLRCGTDVDARHKTGHDGACGSSRAGTALVVSLLCVLVSGLFVRFHVRLR